MAKDAKGHGSDSRGGRQLSVPDQHGLRIARQTLNMPDAMVGVMGGPNKQQAQATVDRLAATTLAAGHPKSGVPPIHPDAAGRSEPGVGSGGKQQNFNFRISGKNVKMRANNAADALIKAQSRYGK